MPHSSSLPLLPVLLALIAFAANSLFCRLALAEGFIDANSFTSVRLLSGSLILVLLPMKHQPVGRLFDYGSWRAAIALFVYAAGFSFAYVQLDAATGALILFASVQFGLIGWSVITGKKLLKQEWLGLAMAFVGFAVLVLPHANVSLQALFALLLMMLAGLAWSAYTLFGKGSAAPLADTRANFVRTLPFTLLLFAIGNVMPSQPETTTLHITIEGIFWAAASGVLASGLGYALWYSVLPRISATQAAVFQLLVPVFAAIGGVIWLGEAVTSSLVIASLLILGGIYVVLNAKR